MKKAKMIGKKTLSVFLAVLMVLTAWVWVAPQKAEAANDSYYYKLEITVNDACTGWSSSSVKLHYRANNGRNSNVESITITEKTDDVWNNAKTHTYESTISGFPCGYTHAYDFGGGLTWRGLKYTVKLSVGSSSSDLKEIYTNTFSAESSAFSAAKGTFGSSTGVGADKYPYIATTKPISATTSVANIGIPNLGDKKDVTISERSIQYYTTDQYGVRYEPTSYTVSGVSELTKGTGWSMGNAYKIQATESTGKSTTDIYQTATVKLNWNNSNSNQTQHADSSYTFRVYNPRYKVTYNGNGGTLGTSYTYGYYGRPINHDTSTATSNNVAGLAAELFPTTGIKEGYTFSGIYTAATGGSKISAAQSVNADVTYYAHWDKNNYTATFYGTKANDAGTDTVEYIISTSTVPFQTVPTAPETVDSYSLGDYDYTFNAWDKEISAIGVNGAEYRATYTSTFVPAVYTDVDEIVEEANAIINSDNYEVIYNEESRAALENAVNSVVYTLGRTSQAVVDAYVPMIRNAIDGLGRQKYSVIFIDSVDNSVIELRYPVYYGDAITLPTAPTRGFTTTEHYVFKEWTPSENGDNMNFVSKNMIIIANYDKVAHTYTDTALSSNCTTQAGVLHKCSCGYEYVEYSGSVGTEHNLETEWTVDIAPTCTTVGSKSHHCTRCSYRADITEIPALDHDFTNGYQGVVINPGCENDGVEVSECQRCGYDKYTLIPQSSHNWKETVVAPTCTSSGYTIKTCANCGDEDIVSFTDPVAHTYVENEEEYIAPTCTGLGKKVSYCSCGAQKVETVSATGHTWNTDTTTDFEATCTTKGQKSIHCSVCDIINQESITEIPKNGHTWGEEICEQKESCGVKGLYVKACSVCQENSSRIVAALTHNYVSEVVNPTCTTKGYTKKTCDICGDVIYTDEKAALNHAWTSTTHAADCTHSAYIEHVCANDSTHNYIEYVSGSTALPHDFTGTETIIKAATCESDGHKTVKCNNCAVTTTVIIPHNGHTWNAWTITKAATNTEKGSMTRTCSNNKCTETVEIPAGGHEWDNGTVTEPATCTKTGTMVYKCINSGHANCTATFECTVSVAQHTIAQKVTPATCIKTGTVEAYCSVCDVNCEKPFRTTETPVVPHTLNNGTAVDSTCTTSGYTLYECTVTDCEFSYKEYDATKPAKGHTYKSEVTTSASCVAEGLKTFTCACGKSYTETIPATGHTYTKDSETTATCTTLGTETYKCSCGDSYTIYVGTIDKSNHSWKGWETVKEATNDSDGYKINECTACGCKDIEIISATGSHIFSIKDSNASKAPTCTEDGYDVFKCSAHTGCTATSTVPVSKLGHNAVIEYKAPTCIATGNSKAVCATCTVTLSTVEIPATGIHDFSGEGVKVDATCTAEGIITYTCETYGCTAAKVEKFPAKGHSFTTTVTDAKCGENGSVITECKVCNDPTVKTVTELAAKGHIWSTEPTATEAATCEKDGSKTYKCQNCNETNVVVIPKLGHTWDDWKVTKPSTNTEEGEMTRTCSIGCTETVKIPAGGHNLVVDTENSKAATCESAGKTVYKCENHTDCGVTIEVTHEKLNHSITSTRYEATCANDGYIERKCSLCKKVISKETLYATAHVFDNGTTFDATCTQAGYVEFKCTKKCNYSFKSFSATDVAKGHNFNGAETVIRAATCTTDGEKTVKCTRCDVKTTVVIPKTGHNYTVTATTDATCEAAATKTYKCNNAGCGNTYVEYVSGTTDHTWSAWSTIQEATTNSYGIEKRVCSVCDVTEHKTTAPTGAHNFEKVGEEAATCTSEGYIDWECKTHTDCEADYRETLDKLPHKEKIAYTAPTCTAEGSTKIVCDTCTATIGEVYIIPAKGHAYNTSSVTTEPGCESKGVRTYSCSCGATRTEEIPAKGHSFKTTVTDATCTSKGLVVTECTVCKKESAKTTIELAAKNHNWNDGKITTPATCTNGGVKTYTCTICGETKTEDVDALGHNWDEWVKVDATNDKDGSWTRTCKNDANHTETLIIPKGNHQWDDGTVTKEASCTETGTKVYKCKTHTDDAACGVTITVTLDKLQHKLETTKTDAKCEADGEVVTKCEHCDTTTITTIIPATGHTFNDGVKTNATCTDTGKIVYTCTAKDCGVTKEVTLDKLQHTFELQETVAATCTTKGYETYKCATCTESYVKFIEGEVAGHNYKPIENTATCVKDGTLTLECETCKDRITADVPALGHDYVENAEKATTATCKAPATKTFECSRQGCDDSYTIFVGEKTEAHNYIDNWTVVNDATETSIGYKTRACTVCGQLEVAVIEATGEHKFTDGLLVDSKAATCTENGYEIRKCSKHDDCRKKATITIEALGHKEIISYTPATCTDTGSAKIICDTCKDTIGEEKIIPALGHTWDDGEVTTQPTCQTEGVMTFKCTVNGCNGTKTTAIAKNSNVHVYSVTTTEATCTTPATTVYKCACGDEKTVVTNFTLGHKWETEKTVEIPATCTSTGIKSTHCANCSETKDEETIPALNHTEKTEKIEATCTTAGYSAEVCDVCKTLLSSVVITEAKGHSWTTKTKAATCTDCATETKTCTVEGCGATETTITGKPTGHTWGEWTIVAGQGKKIRECNNCDATEECLIPTSGHNWNSGEETKAATCYEEGEMKYTCQGCDICTAAGTKATETIAIPKLAHAYIKETTPATCETNGLVVVKCSAEKCGYEAATVTLPKIGHTLVRNVDGDTAATCNDIGWYAYKCNNLNCTYTEKIEVEALGHNYSTAAVETEQPTCTENGSKKYECSRCDAAIVTEIPALGHSFTGTKVVAPTCTEKGYTIKFCSNDECGAKYVVADSFTDALGHSWSEWETVTPATNDADGLKKHICTVANCGVVEYAPIPMLGHQWNDGEVTTAATCETAGEKKYTCIKENCSVCNGTPATYTEIIPATGHKMIENKVAGNCLVPSYSEWTCENNCRHAYITVTGTADGHSYKVTATKDATCEENGEITYKCKDCYAEYTEVTPKLGHSYEKREEPATCTTSGYTLYTCKNNIAHTYKEFNSEPKGHSLGAWTVTLAPTDTVDGTKERSCSDCTYKETQIIPALIHNMVETENLAATCKNTGHITYKCNLTHEGYNKACEYSCTVTLPAAAHSLTTEKSAPSCDKEGYIRTICNNTGCDYKEEIKTAALGHNWNDGETTPSTCQKQGNILYTCLRCGGTKTVKLELAQHTMIIDKEASKEATCTSRGYETYKCSVAGCSYGYSILGAEPTGHQNKKVETTPSTCKMSGLKKTICKDCNTILSVEVLSLAEHTYSSDVKAPTCTEMGYTIYTCGVCGDTYKDNYKSVVPHNFDEIITENVTIVDATCTVDGSKTVKCKDCDATDVTILPATGHINTSVVREESTCIKKGTEKVVCACGHIVSEKELPLAAHNYEMTYENGVYTYTCKVAECKHSYTETVETTFTVKFFAADKKTVLKTEAVKSGEAATAPAAPSKGADDNYHYTFSEWDRDFTEITSDLDVYPTYEKEAHYGGAATCTEKAVCDECGTGYGGTDASKHVIDTKLTPATCEKDGVLEYYCTENGCTYSKTEVIKKTGHSLGAWETYQNGNCATPTIKIRKCRNNGCKYYEQKESYGSHTWYIQPEVAPTCTTVGYSEYKYCTTCGMEIDSVVIPKLNHRDNDGDGNCDYCTYTEPVLKCSCMCHSTGFMKFIYSIVRFFWIITKSQPTCNCGANHY